MKFSLITCIHEQTNAIGKNNNLLFRLKDEMKYFRHITIFTNDINKKNAVIMGYNTWKSIPTKFRPLENRINIIITNKHYNEVNNEIKDNNFKDTYMFNAINDAILFLNLKAQVETCFIIGGESIYKHFIEKGNIDRYYITKIMNNISYTCDSFLPNIDYLKLKQIDKDDIKCEKNCLEIDTKTRVDVYYKFCVYDKI